MELCDKFPDEASATKWFENLIWPDGRKCPRCGCAETSEASKTSGLPYYCSGCKKSFSVKIGTVLEKSKIPLRKWIFAVYLEMTNLKGVSAMKLHRDVGVSYKTAWFMLHRIREVWEDEMKTAFVGPVEVDETFVGGKRKNMPKAKRRTLTGRGGVGKTIVLGAKDREDNKIAATVVPKADKTTLQGFIDNITEQDATVYTDEASAYDGIDRKHETVCHSVSEYVRGMAHTNGIESFWAMLKRGYHGVYHHISQKHLNRYVNEYAGRHNIRDLNTANQMEFVFAGMVGKRLMYKDLTG